MPSTTAQWLSEANKSLSDAGIATARLDCLVLLEDMLGVDRTGILAHPELVINSTKLDKLNKQITQRRQHVPLAYIRGKASFFGREFALSSQVLVPRPETETMIEMLKKLPLPAGPSIADVGTGTGCIGITAASEIPKAKVALYDIDPAALQVARRNMKAFKTVLLCRKSDLLDHAEPADVILANLPYVPERYAINRAAEHEPQHAIFGGKDGLSLYRRLWKQIAERTEKPLFVLTESLPPQHQALAALAKAAGYAQAASEDFIQVFKRA
jgi:release factor glutamine methyltransferase